MTQSTLLHTKLNEFWTILTISRLSPYAFTWDTWNWTNSNTANPRNSCVTNGNERICVFVRYCANIVLNIIKCSQPRFQALPSCGEKTLVGATPRKNVCACVNITEICIANVMSSVPNVVKNSKCKRLRCFVFSMKMQAE
jgi:hypothetical protein